MRKTVLALLLSAFCIFSYSQTKESPVIIRLHGKLIDWDDKNIIYYSMNNEPFSKKRMITTDAFFNYTFDLSKTVYKNLMQGELVFAADTTNKPSEEYSCVHRLNIGEINNYTRSKGKKEIDIHTDLTMTYTCAVTTWYGADTPDEEIFTGTYQLQVKDTTYFITLKKDLYDYRCTVSPTRNDLTNEEDGSWHFDADQSVLNLRTSYRQNKTMGIMIKDDRLLSFKVIKKGHQIEFEPSGEGVLTRLN